MDHRTPAQKDKLYAALRWLPVLIYFVVKYLVFGNDLTRTQLISLIAFVVVAELGLWAYRRRQRRREATDPTDDGTH